MPKGYVILTEAIKDPEGMKAYGRAAGAAMGGVNILAVDTKAETHRRHLARQSDRRAGIRIGGCRSSVVRVRRLPGSGQAASGRGRLQRGYHLWVFLSRNRLRLVHADLVADRPDDEQAAARSAERVWRLR